MDAHHSSLLRVPLTHLSHLTQYLRSHGIHFQAPSTKSTITALSITAAIGLATLASWVSRDYYAWRAFGTGGTPPTPAGYWRMTKIRIAQIFSSNDLRSTAPLSPIGRKWLDIDLPDRTKSRPKMQARTMPQRQVPNSDAKEKLDGGTRQRLHAIPKKFAVDHPDILTLDLSATEGRSTDAVYAKPGLPGRDPSAVDRILGNEIAHVHPADDSLHVWLSEPDARAVVASGWGERFPLGFVHRGWVCVYAPRTDADVDVIEEIVKAGIGYLTGTKF